jgi:hypothetical protein
MNEAAAPGAALGASCLSRCQQALLLPAPLLSSLMLVLLLAAA